MPRPTSPSRPGAPPKPAVAARLVTSAPEGLLRLDFSPPPTGSWTLVRAELARRLAEQAVSRAAAVGESQLAAFAVGRAVPLMDGETPATASPVRATTAAAPRQAPASVAHERTAILRRPDMLTGDALAGRLGVSRATVALRRAAGRLLGLESGTKRGFRYPAWQAGLLSDPQRSALFAGVLELLRPHGPWTAYQFLTEPSPVLDGLTPLDVFATAELQSIRRAVVDFADHLRTAPLMEAP